MLKNIPWTSVTRFTLGLILLLVPLFFLLHCEDVFLVPKKALLYLLLIATLFSWWNDSLNQGRWQLRRTPLTLPLTGWLAAGLISWAVNGAGEFGFQAWMEWAVLTAFFLLAASAEPERLLRFSLASAAVYGGYGALQALGLDPLDWTSLGEGRIYSTWGNPNNLAGALALTLPVLFGMILTSRRAFWVRSLKLLLLLVLAWVLYETRSKAGMLAALTAFTVILAGSLLLEKGGILRQYKRVLAGVLLVAGGVMVLLTPVYWGTVEESSSIRVFLWKSAAEMVSKQPMWGYGPGGFRTHSPFAQSQVWTRDHYEFRGITVHDEAFAHNDYLQVAAESGLVGLACFLWALAMLGVVSIRALRRETDPARRMRILSLLGAWAGYAVYSFFHFPLKVPGLAVTAFAFAAVLLAMAQPAAADPVLPRPPALMPRGPGVRKAIQSAGWLVLLLALVLTLLHLLAAVQYKTGLTAFQLREYDRALPALDRAVRNNPADIGPYFYRAIALEVIGGQELDAERQAVWYGKAEASYQEALRVYPAFMNALYNLANLYRAQNQVKKAENAYLRAIGIKPDFSEAHANLGNLYFGLASSMRDPSYKLQATYYYLKARLEFQRAIQIRPHFVEAHYNLGVLYQTIGQPKAARAEWEEALKYDPGYDPAKKMLGASGSGGKRKSGK